MVVQMPQVSYVGEVLSDGHLSVTAEVRRSLRLRPGERLRVTIARDLVGLDLTQVESLKDLDREALERIAKFRFPQRLQRRMTLLLQKNQEGTLTPEERAELDQINHESLIQRAARKAHCAVPPVATNEMRIDGRQLRLSSSTAADLGRCPGTLRVLPVPSIAASGTALY